MKILHVIPSIAMVHGGPSVMVERMARGTADAGISTEIAATNDDWPGKLDVPCGVPIDRDGVPHWYFDRQVAFYKYSAPLSRWLAANVRNYSVVHIHALFSHASWAAAHWAHIHGVPYIVRPLGVLNRWGMENRRPWLKQLSLAFVETPILRHAALVHYTSEAERAEAGMSGVNAPSVVIPNPVPEEFADAVPAASGSAVRDETPRRPTILFLSRFDRKKGLELLLSAFARVRQALPEAALVLAGAGDEALANELRTQAEKLGIARDVAWPGFLQGRNKAAAFRDAAVFVLPSWSENFGVAVVEAMAAGCPVVVTDQVAIHADISAAGAGYVTPCDAVAIGDAIVRVLSDEHNRRAMGENARRLTLTRYSPAAVTEQLIAAYESVLQ